MYGFLIAVLLSNCIPIKESAMCLLWGNKVMVGVMVSDITNTSSRIGGTLSHAKPLGI